MTYAAFAQMVEQWVPPAEESQRTDILCVAEPPELRQSKEPKIEDSGVRYQRCGGGYRIVRKKIGGN